MNSIHEHLLELAMQNTDLCLAELQELDIDELTNTEINVLLVAIDHMEEHIKELMEVRELRGDMWQERLDACESIRTKIMKNY